MGSSPVRGDHLAITVHQGQRKTQTPRSAQEYTEYKGGHRLRLRYSVSRSAKVCYWRWASIT